MVVVTHDTIGDQITEIGLTEMIEKLDEFITVNRILCEREMIFFGTRNFTENVVGSISLLYFGSTISGHMGVSWMDLG